MKIEIRSLQKGDDRSGFSCGEAELDHFFQKYAGQNQFRHYIGTTYVATDRKRIVGFVSVSVATLTNDTIASQKLPNYPLPVLKIARLAVDTKYQYMGIGKKLLKAMFLLATAQKERIGCVGVVVDAKQDAIPFYEKLGFMKLHTLDKRRYRDLTSMFIAIETIEKAL
jgi:ribosomal protein S18 acetylase RimI-like enzyme